MKHNILPNSQFGFRKEYSTDMAIDNKEHVIGLFFILPKYLTQLIIIAY